MYVEYVFDGAPGVGGWAKELKARKKHAWTDNTFEEEGRKKKSWKLDSLM